MVHWFVKDSYYQRNREQVLAKRKARRAAEPEKFRVQGREQMRRWRASNPRRSPYHGLSVEQIAAAVETQGGCGICGVTEAIWHGDHDHISGKFRGVLCNRCNMALGLFRDDPARCRAAAAYLERHDELKGVL